MTTPNQGWDWMPHISAGQFRILTLSKGEPHETASAGSALHTKCDVNDAAYRQIHL